MTRQNVRRYTYDAAALFTTSTYSAMDKYTFSPSAPRTFPALNIVVPRARSNTTRRERRGRDADEERGVLRDVFDRIPVESECIKPAESSSTFSSDAAPPRSGSNRSTRFGVVNAFVTRGDFAALLRRAVARREEDSPSAST